MAKDAALLLPVRLETRFDTTDRGARLRVLVIPDVCWFDRHQPASQAELDLLTSAETAAGGPLVTGTPATPAAAAAFDALAHQVGPGRALWLARSGRAGAVRTGAQGTRIHGLPAELQLYAVLAAPGTEPPTAAAVLLGTSKTVPELTIAPSGDGSWWPSWGALQTAGLTFSVDLADVSGRNVGPDEIAALYVVGLGDTDAVEMLRPHLEAGDLGLVQQGTPTNTVAGAPAADLGKDPGEWRALGERAANDEEQHFGNAVLGDPAALGPLIGSSDGLRDDSAQLLVPLLWPALAGYVLDEVWNVPDDVKGRARDWATAYLRPDGVLPVLRIREQPYGVWPVTEWRSWVPRDPGDGLDAGEPRMDALAAIRDSMSQRAASGLGTVVGADETRLWELLAQTPTSNGYEVRGAMHVSGLLQFLSGATADAARSWWEQVEAVAAPLANRRPTDPVLTLGGSVPLRMGLVVPPLLDDPNFGPLFLPWIDTPPDEAEKLVRDAPARWVQAALAGFARLFMPQGLNVDMWQRIVEVGWWPASLLWRLLVVSGFVALDQAVRAANPAYDRTQVLADRVRAGLPAGSGGVAVDGYREFVAGLRRLSALMAAPDPRRAAAELDRALRGLLDTASHRVDPWLTGAVWRRLRTIEGGRPVGLYGWVDRPHTGAPGPDLETGLLLAPSDRQARTAIVLRDKSRSDPEARWQLAVTSARVRDAVRLGDEVRTGAHPSEALGREVERVVGLRDRIDKLRAAFPVREEHAGRRTCDGLAVLAAATAQPPDPRLAACGLDAPDITAIAALQRTIDTHADLLVADAVNHALAGRPEAARAAMEAAAGLGAPPPLDLLRTPPAARSVLTTVFAALPAVPAADGETCPVAIASPALAAWFASETGDAHAAAWTWRIRTDAGEQNVDLAAIGLAPADALVIQGPVLDSLAAGAGPGGGGPGGVGPGGGAATIVASPTGPAAVRRLGALVRGRTPGGADVGDHAHAPGGLDTTFRAELRGRLAQLTAAAQSLVAGLGAAADDDARRISLVGAARWGILDAGSLTDRVTAARQALTDRVAAVPANVDSLDVEALTAELGRLAAPDAAIPIFVTAGIPALAAAFGDLAAEPADGGGRPRLDTSWLEMVAAVRPPLARVDAHQALASVQGTAPLAAATNHPADPWLTQVAAPAIGGGSPHLVVLYGPRPAQGDQDVAIGVIDSWAEAVPLEDHEASTAFRFNAPGATAPQALLLAVAPVAGNGLSIDDVLAIVREARETAHARMARPEDLANLDLLAGSLLPAFEGAGFQYQVPASGSDWP